MDKLNVYNYTYDYNTLLNLSQTFIDIVRNSGGKNKGRLLLVASPNKEFKLAFYSDYKIPEDPNNYFAISINYYIPTDYTKSKDYSYSFFLDNGLEYTYISLKKWDTDIDYYEIITNFEKKKSNFVDKGIGVIITEVGVYTEENKEIESIREYLYSLFAIASDYDGIMACLWDTSSKDVGNMNYYNREKNEWYDKKIGENIKKISKKNYVNPSKYIITTNYLKYENIINIRNWYF